jgi:5-methylcytosine-specific restriction endonuclease McrA
MSKLKGGAGSIYQRKDGLWCAAIEYGRTNGKRNRKVIASKNRETVEAKLAELTANRPPVKTRAEYMADARKIATHTPTEWYAKVRALPKVCPYCKTALLVFNMVKDHIIAIEAGGSDGIDNVQPICWECNNEKSAKSDYVYTGKEPRPFSVLPIRRAEYDRIMAVRAKRNRAA